MQLQVHFSLAAKTDRDLEGCWRVFSMRLPPVHTMMRVKLS
jgi:hypothetical protein